MTVRWERARERERQVRPAIAGIWIFLAASAQPASERRYDLLFPLLQSASSGGGGGGESSAALSQHRGKRRKTPRVEEKEGEREREKLDSHGFLSVITTLGLIKCVYTAHPTSNIKILSLAGVEKRKTYLLILLIIIINLPGVSP